VTVVPWAATHLDRRPASILEVVTDSIGLYVSPPVSHLELAARVPGYRTADLEQLMDDRRLIGLRCLRGSAFLIPVELLPVVVPATRGRNVKAFAGYLRKHLTSAPYETWVERVFDVLPAGEALTKSEITERLEPSADERPFMTNLISQMATESRLIGVRLPRSWRSAQIAYTRWSDWLPDVDVQSPDPDEAGAELARLYLRAFGPASVEDFSWWSGLTKTQARAAYETGDAMPAGELFDLDPVDHEVPPEGVRLLPIWDTLFVTWKDRSRLIPEHLLPFVYDASGNATSVVLLDGMPAGVWAMGPDDRAFEVRVAAFESFTKSQWSAVEAEAHVIGGLAGADTVTVELVHGAPNLIEATRNRFMRPV